jgi:hypothetical protein
MGIHLSYSRIEQSTANTEENPHGDCEREAESQRDIEQSGKVRPICRITRNGICNLSARKGKEQEQKGADKLAHYGDDHVACSVGEP